MANPRKSKPVQDILIKNREKLLVFLPRFHEERRGAILRVPTFVINANALFR